MSICSTKIKKIYQSKAKISTLLPKDTNVLPKNSTSNAAIAAKVVADIALTDSIKKQATSKNNGAFPCGSGFPQYTVLLPIPNATLRKPEKSP